MSINITKIFIIGLFFGLIMSCTNLLEEETFSTLGPTNFYKTVEDAEILLNSVYVANKGHRDLIRDYLALEEFNTDIAFQAEGAINADINPIQKFEWSSSHPYLDFYWSQYYSTIFRANTVIDQVSDMEINSEKRNLIVAEAKFLRAYNYYNLYNFFGTVPLILSSESSIQDRPHRASEEEFRLFLISELETIADILPEIPSQTGRASKGAALGLLCRFYMNTKSWQKAIDISEKLIKSSTYSIYSPRGLDERYRNDLFSTDNQFNSEFIFVIPYADAGAIKPADGLTYLSHAAPPGWVWKYSQMVNFAAQFKIRSDYLDLFDDPNDERLNAFVFEYIDQNGDYIQLGHDDVRSFKYPEDPNGRTDVTSSDLPILRISDIYLYRAEALNELFGPNEESINLINEIRNAANTYPVTIGDFADMIDLKNFILDERGREFHTEFLRRQDLIRHGKFIKYANDRGIKAEDYQILYPIPQAEIDRNPNLIQNPGY